MSMESISPAGNVAGAPTAQSNNSEAEVAKASMDQERLRSTDQQAEHATSVGQTPTETSTEDSGGDGKMPWQGADELKTDEHGADQARSQDPADDGDDRRGTKLDLSI